MSTPVNLLAIPTPAGFPETRFLPGSGTKDTLIQWRQLMIPSALGALLLNVITQGMCVRGVNRLTTVSISLRLSNEADECRGSTQRRSTWS
jgi:UDP-xylose/UDP-N-acetylglucosamine transporter B4